VDQKSTPVERIGVDLALFVGLAIRALREDAGISQEELAGRAELDRTYISGIERGVRNPSIKSLQRVANALDVGLEVIFVRARQLADARNASAARSRR
jgi:transcriptional regulator with XRE-family HTH domain